MRGPTHVLSGLSLYALVNPVFLTDIVDGSFQFAFIYGAIFLGSIIPDIDHSQSWIGKRFWFISFPFQKLLGHRMVTHSATGLFIASLLMFVLSGRFEFMSQEMVLAFSIAYASHLLCDWNTNSGIPLFWPFKHRFRAPWSFDTGSVYEAVFGLILAVWLGLKIFSF